MKLDDFLSHIHRNLGPDEVVVTVSAHERLEGAPLSTRRSSISQFFIFLHLDGAQHYPRQNVLPRTTDALMRAYVIVLDDIGTKVDPAKIKLEPTYKLESARHFQWAYVLTTVSTRPRRRP